ncbi:DUF2786 domain-containing protein [Chelatococcus asaccharovorans]|uniref:Uncharacterized protein DUF2786 n=1 Tax=Chelatococcus asaccharovorans TaxID=28210 RepID=A0A2V3UBN6_9HYPH|nr:DUF2786 domain-containing protein [Chelatococcus asaccharovorans]MBS7703288.1 DUF2786 domain-containing protein [Chelatococcus asaccharovorans]PXW61621.1 uncharacterized protein DUF2786 [Chelatococcus asaccharovorans]
MNRDAIIRRIKALLAKTAENGCTEGEALAAAERAQALLRQYQIELAGLETDGFEYTRYREPRSYKTSAAERMAYWIGQYCEVLPCRREGAVYFVGLSSDVMFATWLTESLDIFVNRKSAEYLMTAARPKHSGSCRRRDTRQGDMFGSSAQRSYGWSPYEVERQRQSFQEGIIRRINERLRDICAARPVDARKRDLITAEMAKRDMKLGTPYRPHGPTPGDYAAYQQGRDAGDRAGFGKPVNGGAAPLQIGALS